MDEKQINKLFVDSPTVNLTAAEVQFQAGVAKFGLVEVLPDCNNRLDIVT